MSASADIPKRRGLIRRIVRVLLICFLALLVACMAGWCVLFLYYSYLPVAGLRTTLAILFGLSTLAGFVVLSNRRRTLLYFLGTFAVLVIWYFSISPSND